MPPTATFRIMASKDFIQASAEVSDRRDDLTPNQAREIAQSFAAQFPKSAGVKATSLSGADYREDENGQKILDGNGQWIHARNWTSALLGFRAVLAANGVNGGVNEGGIKRYRAFRRHCGRLGYTIEWTTQAGNALNEAAFEALIGK